MQNGFVSSRSKPVLPHVRDLVHRWEIAGGATVFTRFVNEPDSPFERLIGWTRMQSAPDRAVAVVEKSIYSLFTPEGANLVREHGWTDLVICGIATESCVLKTACDAFERNLTPWIVTDASFSHAGQQAHDAGLFVAGRFIGGGQLVTSDTVLNQMATVALANGERHR